ncbi:PQQ-binding-like beta-propeller repeat protein [Natronosalvus vescus]|uniref:outer membrane protein assembly factor BamB family protein n=1 Tax=Natronosalvus vescus TaxID=2953881 RepID=UPI00209012DE|nr:PQQ-binding-like beta-propeller repeat protein [Natronosalvus vescus]
MRELPRRTVLATGVALTSGSVLGSKGIGATDADAGSADDLPDSTIEANPEMDDDWPSHRGDPGHARYIDDGHAFDGDSLEAAWSVEHGGLDSVGNVGTVAVADDTVYTTTEDGVAALEAADGSVVWENTEVEAGTPSVVDERVYLSGYEVVALDRTDGSVVWETEFDPEEEIYWQTVAYGGVYVVVDGTLYALDADDGSILWEKESVTAPEDFYHGEGEAEYEFVTATAAANGVIYSVTGAGPIAFEPETGEEVWREEREPYTTSPGIHATSTAVAYYGGAYNERLVHDATTGEWLTMAHGTRELAIGEELYVGGGTDQEYNGGPIDGDEPSWSLDVTYTYGRAVISGDTVYAYLYQDGHNYGDRDYDEELVALDKYDGSEKWTVERGDAPVGAIRAISGETIYVDHDSELVALRESPDEDDQQDEDDGTDDDLQDDPGDEDSDEEDGTDEDGNEEPDENGSDDDDSCPDDDGGGCPDDDETDGEDTAGSGDGDGDTDDGTGGSSDDDDAGEADESASQTGQSAADDGMPGFTVGASALSGLLGLEWLRRRADTDESTEK